jgi:hypothetical protein
MMKFAGRLFGRPKFCPDHFRWLDIPKLSIGNNLQIS